MKYINIVKSHWSHSQKREEVAKKISLQTKGRHLSAKSEFKKGHVMSDEIRKKISETLKGRKPHNLGKKTPLEIRKKISASLSGEKSPFWKNGLTQRNLTVRLSLEYRDWIKRIFERDEFTCQICGEVGGKLNANHIKKFSDYPELRMDERNGITLCEKCHKIFVNWKEKKWEGYFKSNFRMRGLYLNEN